MKAALLPFVLFPPTFQGPSSSIKPELKPLSYFEGEWKCDGHFVKSDRKIAAQLTFQIAVDGSWLTVRHNDLPPNHFHAFELWGFDSREKQYVAVIVDNGGTIRFFTSAGWESDRLVWTGNKLAPEENATQHFVFEKKSPQEFSVTYEVTDGAIGWKSIDVLACIRQPIV